MSRILPPLHLDPQFMPPEQAAPPSTSMVPPLQLDPSLTPPSGLFPRLPPAAGALTNLFGHLTDSPAPKTGMDMLNGAIEGLGTRRGLQADQDGIGGTVGDWRMRFMPITPLNSPGD